jgi:hypothetical protein
MSLVEVFRFSGDEFITGCVLFDGGGVWTRLRDDELVVWQYLEAWDERSRF